MSQDSLALAEQALRRGEKAEAEQLASQSSRPEALQFRAMLALQGGRLADAGSHMGRYVKLRQHDPNGWFNLGLIRSHQGDPTDAEAAFRRAISLSPQHGQAVAALAELRLSGVRELLGSGKPSQAQALLEDPLIARLPQVLDAQAAVLHALGEGRQAVAMGRKALAAAPDNLRIKTNLAAVLSSHTDPESIVEAGQLANQVLAQRPSDGAAHHCLAIVEQKGGQLGSAISHAHAAVAAQPSLDHWLTLADLQAVSSPAQSVQTLIKATSQLGQGAELPAAALAPLHRQRGIALLRLSRVEEALSALDQALALAPWDQRTIAHRGVALAASGQWERANRWLGIPQLIERQPLGCPDGFVSMAAFNAALANDIAGHSLMRWEPLGLAARNGGLTDNLLADDTPAIRGFETSLRAAIDALIANRAAIEPFEAAFPGPRYQLNIWATLVHAGGNIDTHIHEESWLSGAYYVQLPGAEIDAEPANGPANGPAYAQADGPGDRPAAQPTNQSQPAIHDEFQNLPPQQQGAIEFGRPHADLPQAATAVCEVLKPKEGELLLFPSYLFHRTLPHRSQRPRISISFDVSPLSG